MEMFLMALCVSVFGMGVAAAAFGATRSESSDSPAQPQPPLARAVAPTRFFSDNAPASPALPSRHVPIDVLLLQIENHVRLEQAAAELFIATPTQAQLHSKTNSPFVN